MFFSDTQLVIKKNFVFYSENWMWKWKKMTSLKDSNNFTIVFDHQFDINEKQNWGTSETILGVQTSFSDPARSFFYLLTQWHHQTFISFAQYMCVCVYIYIYIYIYINVFFKCISLSFHAK